MFVKLIRGKIPKIRKDFDPGFVSKNYLKYQELSEDDDVKERLYFISTNQLLKKQLKHGDNYEPESNLKKESFD